MSAADSFNYSPTYGRLVPVCKAHGICKSDAFRLARDGLLDTFLLQGKRMVYLASLESLPRRLPASQPTAVPEGGGE